MTYDKRAATYSRYEATFSSVNGTVSCRYELPAELADTPYAEYVLDTRWSFSTSKLVFDGDRFWLHAVMKRQFGDDPVYAPDTDASSDTHTEDTHRVLGWDVCVLHTDYGAVAASLSMRSENREDILPSPLTRTPMRVVTLLPSATEIVYALGVSPVAVSHECDHPPAARSKPVVNHARIDATASSAEIDRQVLRAERDGGGVYEIDLDTLASADPDLIVTQGLCDVCAVDRVLVEDAVAELDIDCEILTTDPHSLGDIRSDIERIGAAVGRDDRATEMVEAFDARIDAVRTETAKVDERPNVIVLDWMDPVMTAGHWVPEMVSIAGGRSPFDAEASVPREWSEIRAVDPAVLVVAPCGFDLEQTAQNRGDLTDREGWAELAAVADGRVYAIDGHQYMNRPGTRIVDSLEHLAGAIHPEQFGRPPTDAAQPFDRLTGR